MENLLWIGSPFFSPSLGDCGWPNVFSHNFEGNRVFGWDDLVRLAGFVPDVLVVADKSIPPFVLGVEDFPCLTVFYGVDSHIHSWQPWYAQAFDLCLVSLRDHRPNFVGPYLLERRVLWSPPFAHQGDQPQPDTPKEWDCLFVGNVNGQTPKRSAFLDELGQRLPSLQVTRGNYRTLFPKARVVVNQCEHGDLNFRVFEALGCGACLVTPRIGHGFEQMFVDGEHLVAYVPDDVGDALFRIQLLLEEPEIAQYIAATGLAEVNAKHRAIHRAQAFTDKLCDMFTADPAGIIAARRARAAEIRARCLRMPYLLWAETLDNEALKAAYLAAANGQQPQGAPAA